MSGLFKVLRWMDAQVLAGVMWIGLERSFFFLWFGLGFLRVTCTSFFLFSYYLCQDP